MVTLSLIAEVRIMPFLLSLTEPDGLSGWCICRATVWEGCLGSDCQRCMEKPATTHLVPSLSVSQLTALSKATRRGGSYCLSWTSVVASNSHAFCLSLYLPPSPHLCSQTIQATWRLTINSRLCTGWVFMLSVLEPSTSSVRRSFARSPISR